MPDLMVPLPIQAKKAALSHLAPGRPTGHFPNKTIRLLKVWLTKHLSIKGLSRRG